MMHARQPDRWSLMASAAVDATWVADDFARTSARALAVGCRRIEASRFNCTLPPELARGAD
jgi:hypothetical protein